MTDIINHVLDTDISVCEPHFPVVAGGDGATFNNFKVLPFWTVNSHLNETKLNHDYKQQTPETRHWSFC